MHKLSLRIIDNLADFPVDRWNALAGDDPFLAHAFLHALQASGCATAPMGWQAQFISLWQGEHLMGAMPLYLKMNSYGEFVFDFAWADAYQRHGLRYYPKLVCSVPFSPITGCRLLAETAAVKKQLLEHALVFAQEMGVSSLHCLFLNAAEALEAESQSMLMRQDVQFHWHNPGYRDFDDFLSTLTRDKRKRIKQERRKVQEAGIELQCLSGEQMRAEHWEFFARCYLNTLQQRHSPPQLNADFFRRIGASMADQSLLVIALRAGRPIAGALNMRNAENLYGRSWGCFEFHSGLHFEACYYQAMEFCIANKIKVFEGGAQGEHKLARGFLPTLTRSAHWLAHPQFARAVEDYLRREGGAISDYCAELQERSPFKKE